MAIERRIDYFVTCDHCRVPLLSSPVIQREEDIDEVLRIMKEWGWQEDPDTGEVLCDQCVMGN